MLLSTYRNKEGYVFSKSKKKKKSCKPFLIDEPEVAKLVQCRSLKVICLPFCTERPPYDQAQWQLAFWTEENCSVSYGSQEMFFFLPVDVPCPSWLPLPEIPCSSPPCSSCWNCCSPAVPRCFHRKDPSSSSSRKSLWLQCPFTFNPTCKQQANKTGRQSIMVHCSLSIFFSLYRKKREKRYRK